MLNVGKIIPGVMRNIFQFELADFRVSSGLIYQLSYPASGIAVCGQGTINSNHSWLIISKSHAFTNRQFSMGFIYTEHNTTYDVSD